MPVYPAIPLPVPGAPLPVINGEFGGLPPGGTSGVMPGLEGSLLAILRNYRPGDIGICELADKLQLVLPVPDWATYAWTVEGTVAVPAGVATEQILYTVADDTRCWLDALSVNRTSGDNTWNSLEVIQAPGYGEGTRLATLVALQAANARIWWPGPRDVPPFRSLIATPMLLEPGAYIRLIPNGDGVAISNANYEIVMRHTKIMRQAQP